MQLNPALSRQKSHEIIKEDLALHQEEPIVILLYICARLFLKMHTQ